MTSRTTVVVGGAVNARATAGPGTTTIWALPSTRSAMAVIRVVPVVRPVTTPAGETSATSGLALRQVTDRPFTAYPPALRRVTAREMAAPARTSTVPGR